MESGSQTSDVRRLSDPALAEAEIGRILARYRRSPHDTLPILYIVVVALKHPNCPVDEIIEWARRGHREAQADPRVPAEALTDIALNPRVACPGELRWYVLTNPNASPDLLHAAATSDSVEAQRMAADHPNTRLDTQLLLVSGGDLPTLSRLCRRENLSPEVREAMEAFSGNPTFLVWAIRAGNATPAMLGRAEVGGVIERRTAAAFGTDPDMLERLALDRDKDVRRAASANPACPEEARVAASLLNLKAQA